MTSEYSLIAEIEWGFKLWDIFLFNATRVPMHDPKIMIYWMTGIYTFIIIYTYIHFTFILCV